MRKEGVEWAGERGETLKMTKIITSLLVVVQRWPAVPTLANKVAGITRLRSASSITVKGVKPYLITYEDHTDSHVYYQDCQNK